jgi:antitoxin YafN
MSTQKILAEETVSITDFRKSPSSYFTDHVIGVLSNNKPEGYVIGAEAYEAIVAVLKQAQATTFFEGRFKPTAERMREITKQGAQLLTDASEEDLGRFSE